MLTPILLGACVFLLLANLGVQVARLVGPKPEEPKRLGPAAKTEKSVVKHVTEFLMSWVLEDPITVVSWRVIPPSETSSSLRTTYCVALSDDTTWEGGRDATQNWWHDSENRQPDAEHAKILEGFLNERENTDYVNATRAV